MSALTNSAEQTQNTLYGPVNFDYNEFLRYYKEPQNYTVDITQNITKNYYSKPRFNNKKSTKKNKKGYRLNTRPLSQNFIRVNGKKIYITFIGSNDSEILFTTPIQDASGVWWDDHFHFGLNSSFKSKRITQNNRKLNAIFFHKTIQDPSNNESIAKHCHFEDNIDLKQIDVEDFKCHDDRKHIMSNAFPADSEDFAILKEIIQRPFLHPNIPGGIGGKRRRRIISKTRRRAQRRSNRIRHR